MKPIPMFFGALFLAACGATSISTSLDDTTPDGALVFDDAGRLVVDDEARRAFDYVLLAEEELSEPDLEAWFGFRLDEAGFTDDEVDQVLEAFGAYRRYRTRAAAALTDPSLTLDQARSRIDRARSAELARTPLADDEATRTDRAFAIRAALHESDPAERRRQVEALTAPASERFRQSLGGRYFEAHATVEAARDDDLTPAQLARVRREAFAPFGPDAVARLEALHRARADFEHRVAQLADAAEELRSQLPAAAAEAALAEQIAEGFTEAEQRRVPGALQRHQAR